MNINQLMKQAQQMQRKLTKAQNEFNERAFDFASSDQMISGQMKGNMEIISLHIDESLLSDKAMLEDMLLVVLNEARKKIANQKEEELGKLTGNVNIPNLF